MKIIQLKAENIKNLKAIEINPQGNDVILSGKNGAGKSAILDSILMAITGKSKKIKEPIKNGERKACIEIDMGDYKVKRVFTEKTDRLELLSAEGAKFPSPQTMLNTIIGKLSFDPLEFSKMKSGAQRDVLMSLVGLDFTDLDKQETNVFDSRYLVKKELVSVTARMENIKEPTEQLPEKEISIKDKVGALEELQAKKKVYDDVVIEKSYAENQCSNIRNHIEREREKIVAAEAKIKDFTEHFLLNQKMADAELPLPVVESNIREFQKTIVEAEEINRQIVKGKDWRLLKEKAGDLKKEVEDLTEDIEGFRTEKLSRINKAEYPLKGLTVSDEMVVFENKPFNQLSTGEQIEVSTAIAMKLNPKLKIILIREGSLLDNNALQSVISMAKENDYQIWIEKVSENNTGVGIYIENGNIVEKKEVMEK